MENVIIKPTRKDETRTAAGIIIPERNFARFARLMSTVEIARGNILVPKSSDIQCPDRDFLNPVVGRRLPASGVIRQMIL